MANITELGDEQ